MMTFKFNLWKSPTEKITKNVERMGKILTLLRSISAHTNTMRKNAIKVQFFKFTAEKIKKDEERLCVERLGKDIAIVQIHFSTPFVMRMKQDVRKTFTDKISDIGNKTIKIVHPFC